uniref:Galactose mutarotase n=1 Tax=Timema genevievae TaxID=629358 RepID=A0A7R9K6T8_TIMGE|nr:unnamed protein product [Timema genevievae]
MYLSPLRWPQGLRRYSCSILDCRGQKIMFRISFWYTEEYASKSQPYFGATVGRVANRIKNGKFSIGNQQFNTTKNRGNNTLHGGADGFNFKSGATEVYKHTVKINAFGFTKTDSESIPTDTPTLGSTLVRSNPARPDQIHVSTLHTYESDQFDSISRKKSFNIRDIVPVDNTPFDLRNSTILGEGIKAVSKFDDKGGYDHNFCINSSGDDDLAFVARVEHPTSGIAMEVHADQPGVQFYTGNGLSNATVGKGSTPYSKHGAFCLETQNYPDAVNHVCDHIANYSFFVNLHS